MKNFAVVISGCGFKDGAEITESISTLIALAEAKIQYQVFAPNLTVESVNHLTGEKEGTHSVLAEAARISRGKIQDLKNLDAHNFEALIFPGGFGVAQHLCDFALAGAKCRPLPDAKRVIEEFHKKDKPIGAFCIAPALIASVLGHHGVTLTIGNHAETAKELEKMGAIHANCAVDDYVTDRETKIITTPAYMYDEATPFQVFTGIRRAIREIIEMS